MKIGMSPANGLFMTFIFFIVMGLATTDDEETTSEAAELPPDFYNETCAKGNRLKWWGGPNCFAWVVRIIISDWYDEILSDDGSLIGCRTRTIATGNIITENWILTACTPFHRVIGEERFEQIKVLPAVAEYTDAAADRVKGIFPYCSHKDGCILGIYRVRNLHYQTVDGEICTNDTDAFPAGMVHNVLLLRMASPIKVSNFMMFPRMPFSYNFVSLMKRIDWLNSYRKARCVIAKPDPDATWDPDDTDKAHHSTGNLYEQRGFTYRTLPYKTECMAIVCRKNCTYVAEGRQCMEEEKREKGSCWLLALCLDKCKAEMERLIGSIMCLVRMDEHPIGITNIASYTYDFDDKMTDWPTINECHPKTMHPAGRNPHYMGAPVVCDGEVIAVVTKCEDTFIMATSLAPIRHQLLKLFDTSYQESLVFLSDE